MKLTAVQKGTQKLIGKNFLLFFFFMLKGIDFHHPDIYANAITDKQFDKVNVSHKNRWGEKVKSSMGFYAGYHFFVERDGEIRQAREVAEVGAHNDADNRNKTAIGICIAGNMQLQKVTNEQVIAVVELVRKLQKEGKIDPDESNYQPHRHWKATACPGAKLPDNTWSFLVQLYDVLHPQLLEEEPIVKWCKKWGIMTQFSSPPTKEEIRHAWTSYKTLKMLASGDFRRLDFPL